MKKQCLNCNKEFDTKYNGKIKSSSYKRKFCYECSPFNSHNTANLLNNTFKSKIFKLNDDEFKLLIQNSNSRSEIFSKLKLRKSGHAFKILDKRIKENNLDVSHFIKGGNKKINRKYSNDEIFKICDRELGQMPRERILSDNLKEYKCEICGIKKWNEQNLCLQLDHINGNRYDNRLENLRFLCPNCHSQTETFCGKKRKTIIYYCSCGNEKLKKSNNCLKCANENRKINGILKRKVERPSKEVLELKIKSNSFLEISRIYKVSDATIRKWCKYYNLPFRKRDLNL